MVVIVVLAFAICWCPIQVSYIFFVEYLKIMKALIKKLNLPFERFWLFMGFSCLLIIYTFYKYNNITCWDAHKIINLPKCANNYLPVDSF